MRRIRRDKGIETEIRRNVPVFEAPPEQGLSTRQAEERAQAGWDNRPIEPDVYKRQYSPRANA